MTIKTERLILKEISWEDLEDIHLLNSYLEVDEFNTRGIPENIEITKKLVKLLMEDQYSKKRKSYSWCIRLKKTNEFIGEIGMNLSAERFKMAEIYYNIVPKFWGNGYATKTAYAVLKLGFRKLKLHRIEAGVATKNVRSINVLEKLGMTREGLRRKILPIRGEWKDNYHYAILEEEFK